MADARAARRGGAAARGASQRCLGRAWRIKSKGHPSIPRIMAVTARAERVVSHPVGTAGPQPGQAGCRSCVNAAAAATTMSMSEMALDSFDSLGSISGISISGIPSMNSADLQAIIHAVAGNVDSGSESNINSEILPDVAVPDRQAAAAAKAFAKVCQVRSSELQQRLRPFALPTEGELSECINAIRLRIESKATAESRSDKRGKSNHCIEQLSMQLKIISRDYHNKLCAYVQTFLQTTMMQQDLLNERSQMLPVAEQHSLETKLLASTRQSHDIIQRALAQFERDATDLYQEFRNQHLKKKEKLPVSLQSWSVVAP